MHIPLTHDKLDEEPENHPGGVTIIADGSLYRLANPTEHAGTNNSDGYSESNERENA